ncbi:MAG TPA: hypothetical protein VLW47_09590 [Thermodesulfobacteriota bacterium]|nr:hypothetical protein [Thermodesulfobacteriota bacterium]
MNFGSFQTLTSGLTRLRSKRKQRRATCPNCRGGNVELVNQMDDEEGYWSREEYLCNECECEWDWTYKRPFFRWRRKIRAPKWVRLD